MKTSEPICESAIAKRLAEVAPLAVLVLRDDGVIAYANAYLCSIIDVAVDEMTSSDWFETYVPAGDRERCRQTFEAALAGRSSGVDMNCVVARTGERRFLEWTHTSLFRESDRRFLLHIGLDATARVELQETRRADRDKLRGILDAIYTPVGLLDTEGMVLEANAASLGEAGLPRQGLKGKPFWEMPWFERDPATRAKVEAAFRSAAAGAVARDRFVARMAEGVEAPLDIEFAPVRRSGGEIDAVVAAGVNVLRQTLAEKAAEADRAKLEEAQRIAKLGSWELRFAGRELCWSAEVYRILEVDPALARPSYAAFLKIVHPADRSRVDETYRRLLAKREAHDLEYRLLLEHGRTKWVHERCETSFDDGGRAIVSRGTLQDVTERRHVQEALWRSEQTLSSILSVSHEAIIVTDQEGTVRLFSKGAEDIFRAGQEEILGRRIDELIPERFRGQHARHLRDFAVSPVASLRMNERMEIVGLRKTGEEFAAEASVSKVVCEDGVVFAVILRDISERKAYEAALRSAKRKAEQGSEAKSAFLATMSHEIRTPMNGVLGMLSVLQGATLDDLQKDIVETALEAARSLMDILNDILDYSKIEAGALRLEIAPFDIRSVLTKVCSLHVLTASRKQVSIKVDTTPDAPSALMGDATRIRQILHNLVSNAIKFTEKGSVHVAAAYRRHPEGGVLEIDVRDTGIGMSADQLELIFDRFSQADSSITRRFGGSGLGLAIVKGLIDAMGGEILVSSQLGHGSTFSLKLPMTERVPVAAVVLPETAPSIDRSRDLRVLVVEDNDPSAKVLQLLLEQEGVALTLARNGEEAIAAFEPGAYDLILMDIQMPLLDGESAMKVMRRLEMDGTGWPSRIVACTAFARSDKNAHYLRTGFNHVLEKPVDPEKLRHVLRDARAHRASHVPAQRGVSW